MKISKDRLKEIIKEELEEADMRGTTSYTNPKFDGDREEFKSNRALTGPEARKKHPIAYDLLADMQAIYSSYSPDDVERLGLDGVLKLTRIRIRELYKQYMSRLRNEDPEAISISQSAYPKSKPGTPTLESDSDND